jgi:hypothetical protein
MSILTVQWDLRAFWAVVTVSAKLYLVCLFLMAAYTIIHLVKVMYDLKTLRWRESDDVELLRLTLVPRMRHLRQIHFLFLLIFGACFASEFFGIIRAIRYSTASLSAARMEIFEPATAFAFVVFVALSFLHVLQWVVSSRVDTAIGSNASKNAVRDKLLAEAHSSDH